jgi:hypothetical protein
MWASKSWQLLLVSVLKAVLHIVIWRGLSGFRCAKGGLDLLHVTPAAEVHLSACLVLQSNLIKPWKRGEQMRTHFA